MKSTKSCTPRRSPPLQEGRGVGRCGTTFSAGCTRFCRFRTQILFFHRAEYFVYILPRRYRIGVIFSDVNPDYTLDPVICTPALANTAVLGPRPENSNILKEVKKGLIMELILRHYLAPYSNAQTQKRLDRCDVKSRPALNYGKVMSSLIM